MKPASSDSLQTRTWASEGSRFDVLGNESVFTWYVDDIVIVHSESEAHRSGPPCEEMKRRAEVLGDIGESIYGHPNLGSWARCKKRVGGMGLCAYSIRVFGGFDGRCDSNADA